MNELGFTYDSTERLPSEVRKIENLTEIPIGIMDVDLKRLAKNHASWLGHSLDTIEASENSGVPFFEINFHDVYFSAGYPDLKNWYASLIKELRNQNYEFIDFDIAIKQFSD